MIAPLTTFIFKVASRCNLDCDYCYVYHHADQSWRTQPRFMPFPVVERAAGRVARHASAHGLDRILVVLLGGEPTLAGPAWVDTFCGLVRRIVPQRVHVDFAMQSNGTLLDRGWPPVLTRQRIRVGISLDGPRQETDRHRRDFAGRSSYDATTRGINFLRHNAPDTFAGLLCVVDLAADPVAVYEHLASFEPPMIDFNLPDAQSDNPSPGRRNGAAAYGQWLIAVFEAWTATSSVAAPSPRTPARRARRRPPRHRSPRRGAQACRAHAAFGQRAEQQPVWNGLNVATRQVAGWRPN